MSGLTRGIAQARAEIEGFDASIRGTSSDVQKASADTERLGNDVKNARNEFSQWESHIPIVGGMLDKMNRSLLDATGGLFKMIPGMTGVGQSIQESSPMLAAFLSWGEAIPAALFIAVFAVNALADALGTMLAFVGDLVAPVGLLGGLLGALGLGFVLAGKRALDGGKQFSALHHVVDQVKSKFTELTTTLAHDFMPIFMQLGHDAESALTFLNQIAKLPLDEAFKKLAQQGIPAVQKFFNYVGGLVAKPIRLAFQIAFGVGTAGNEASSFVSNLWNQFQNFWLGYTKTKKLNFNGHIVVTQTQVNGALQPFLDWFHRHDFTKQGEKIGRQILHGLKPLAAPLGQFLITVLEDAAKQSVRDMIGIYVTLWRKFRSLGQEAHNAIIHYGSEAASAIAGFIKSKTASAWGAVKSAAGAAWSYIRNKAGGILQGIASSIEGKLSSAWNAVKSAAQGVWDAIKAIFEAPLHIHVSWPSLPSLSSLTSLVGKATATGGMLAPGQASIVGERGPELFVPSGAGNIIPNHRSFAGGSRGGGDLYLIFPNTYSLDRNAARDLARQIQPHLTRQVFLRSR